MKRDKFTKFFQRCIASVARCLCEQLSDSQSCINFLPPSNKNTKDKYLIINFLGTCAVSHWRDAAALETIILRWNWENKLSSCREFGKDIVVAQKVGISYCSMAGIPRKKRIMNFERRRKFLVRREEKLIEAWQDGSDIYSTSSTLCKILIVPSRDSAAAPTDEEMSPAFHPSPVAQESLKWHKFHSCASVWVSTWRKKNFSTDSCFPRRHYTADSDSSVLCVTFSTVQLTAARYVHLRCRLMSLSEDSRKHIENLI